MNYSEATIKPKKPELTNKPIIKPPDPAPTQNTSKIPDRAHKANAIILKQPEKPSTSSPTQDDVTMENDYRSSMCAPAKTSKSNIPIHRNEAPPQKKQPKSPKSSHNRPKSNNSGRQHHGRRR